MDTFSMTFNGKNSYSDFGLKIKSRPPRPKPERNVDKIEIPDRDGYLTVDHGTYKGFTLTVNCMLLNATGISEQARDIKAWLDGSGDLIFSDDTAKYKATVINQFDVAEEINNYGEFEVVFDCQPLAESDTVTTELTSAGIINNVGIKSAKPIITVYGSGSITLTINNANIILTNVSDYVTIDSVLVDCYKDTVLKNSDMNGNFPELLSGANSISWTGTVTKVVISYNLRWL